LYIVMTKTMIFIDVLILVANNTKSSHWRIKRSRETETDRETEERKI